MKKINLKGLDLDIYQETLNNGLNIYYLPMFNNNIYNIQYVAKFGGKNTYFDYNNKRISIPEGTAHYLEHKLFESEDNSNIHELFNNHATYNNAYTNDKRTAYMCSGTNYFEEDLKLLIKFVSNPYFTKENIEKERGIIEEEIKQSEDNIYKQIYNSQLKDLYHSKEYKQTVIGTSKTISKINKELLYNIYNTFYQPDNMYIVITGNFDIKQASNIINKLLSKNKNKNTIKIPTIKEKEQVVKKYTETTGNNETNKVLISIKKDISNINISKFEIDVYLYILIECLFGDSSNFRQDLFDKKLVTSFFTNNELNDNYEIIRIFAVSDKIDKFIKEIENYLKNITIDEKTFNRIKKVIISNLVIESDYSENMINSIVAYLSAYNDLIPDRLELIRNLNLENLNKIIKEIDFNNKNITIIKKKS